jgi:hypothetical protein
MVHNYNDYLKSHNKDIVVVVVINFVVNVLAHQQQ